MQIRYATNLSAEQYVQQQAWHAATLSQCPLHPQGGCRFSKHGTYPRKFPEGTKIARWYCVERGTSVINLHIKTDVILILYVT